MVDTRKQAISIRMNAADVRKVKKLAQRLSVRDSDVIRFAVKCMLSRLSPLYDPTVKGRNLMPVFVESGAELLRFFDLDAARLEAIINDAVEPGRRVDRDDIALLAMTGGQATLGLDAGPAAIERHEGSGEIDAVAASLPLHVIRADDDELKAHRERLKTVQKKSGKCLWADDLPTAH